MSRFGILATIGVLLTGCAGAPRDVDGPLVLADVAPVVTSPPKAIGAIDGRIRFKFGGDVHGEGATNGQALVWDGTQLRWEPGTISISEADTLATVVARGNTFGSALLPTADNTLDLGSVAASLRSIYADTSVLVGTTPVTISGTQITRAGTMTISTTGGSSALTLTAGGASEWYTSTGTLRVGTVAAAALGLFTNGGSDDWTLEATNGHFLPGDDNLHNIGSGTFRVASINLGTQIDIGTNGNPAVHLTGSSGLGLGTGLLLGFTGANGNDTFDAGIQRQGAGVLVVNDGGGVTDSDLATLRYLACAIGAASTSGARLEVNAGVLTVREGDDTADAPFQALTLASSVSTGTAPFSCSSTTVVTNLNADLLDGISSAAFLANPAAAQLSWTTGLGAITHLLGPTDQTFAIGSPGGATPRAITMGPATVGANNAAGAAVTITGGTAGTTSGNTGGLVTVQGGANGGSGNARNGGSVAITGADGAGTTGVGGSVTISVGASGTSGGSDGLLVVNDSDNRRRLVTGSTVTLTDNSAVSIFGFTSMGSSESVTGVVHYGVYAADGTDFQIASGTLYFSAVDKAGTLTSDIDDPTSAATIPSNLAASSGTLTLTWTILDGSSAVDVQLNANTSLTATTLQCRWTANFFLPAVTSVGFASGTTP